LYLRPADQLERACVELAKEWRTEKYLRQLEVLVAAALLPLLHFLEFFVPV
jgi:ATP-dependent protease HslVU (ClpYQ) peptidase subunit